MRQVSPQNTPVQQQQSVMKIGKIITNVVKLAAYKKKGYMLKCSNEYYAKYTVKSLENACTSRRETRRMAMNAGAKVNNTAIIDAENS